MFKDASRQNPGLSVVLVFFLMGVTHGQAASVATDRCVILVTLDGLRPEEVFGGADQRLITKENGVEKPEEVIAEFWADDRERRREILLPFLWSQCLGGTGWIAGDVEVGSRVEVTNGRYFSYPGYNEILCGFADPAVDSNDKKYNQNTTVPEWLHDKREFAGKIAAYCSWDVFPFIINDQRSRIPVNAGWQSLSVGNRDRIESLNFVADHLFHQWSGVRYDVITAGGAIEEIRAHQPRVLYVSLGETDDWAHGGRYDRYLLAAQQNDRFIRKLWNTIEQLPAYKGKTLFVVTTDHGRGDDREGWKNHGATLPGSERIWIAIFGNGLTRHGIDENGRYEQAQVAATVAAYLGYDFTEFHSSIHPPLPVLANR